MRPPTKPAEHWKQKRTSQPGTLIKRPTRPAVWQLIKPDQSPPALRKALQLPPLPTVQEALARMRGVGDLIGGGLHPTTPASIEAQPAVPLAVQALLASVCQPPRPPLAVLHQVEPTRDIKLGVATLPVTRLNAVVELHSALARVGADRHDAGRTWQTQL